MYSDVSGRPAHRPTQTYNCNQGANTVQILYERHESLLRPQSRNLIVCPGTAIDKHFAEFVGPGGRINCKCCGDDACCKTGINVRGGVIFIIDSFPLLYQDTTTIPVN